MADDDRPPARPGGGASGQRSQLRIGLIAGGIAFVGGLVWLLWKRGQGGGQSTATSTGGVAPGYGTQLGDLIQFAPADQGGGASGGPGGVAGGASGGQILPGDPLHGRRPAQRMPGPFQIITPGGWPGPFTGPGGVQSQPLVNPIRPAVPAPAPPAAPRPIIPTQPQRTVPGRLPLGVNVVNARTLGILGPTQTHPAPVVVAGSVPPRNLPAGLSVDNAKRLGL